MQDCNEHLDNAICTAISAPDMSAYHYLTSLEFVKDASGCKTHFGRIPHADVRFPHLYHFPKLTPELFKVGRLLGSSNNTYAILTSPEIHLSLVHYMAQIDNWFGTVSTYNFAQPRISWIGSSLTLVSLFSRRRVSLLICLETSRNNISSAIKSYACQPKLTLLP
jgi:hypothetical protein